MRLSARMIATAAFAIFLMPAFLLRADEAAKPSTGAGNDKAGGSNACGLDVGSHAVFERRGELSQG